MARHTSLALALGFVAALFLAPAAGAFEDECVYHGTSYTCEDYCSSERETCTIDAVCPCWPGGLPEVEPYLCFDASWAFNHLAVAIVPPATPTLFQASYIGCRAGPVFVPAFTMSPGQLEACDEDLFRFCEDDACEDKCWCDDTE